MFGLVELIPEPRERLWNRLTGIPRRGSIRCGETVRAGCRFIRLGLSIPEGCGEKRLRQRAERAAALLRRMGVRQAVFPGGFLYSQEFERQDVRPVDTLPLYRAAAAELALAAIRDKRMNPEQTLVAAAGRSMTHDMQAAMLRLVPQVRYVGVFAGRDGERFCRRLEREYGAPVISQPAGRRPGIESCLLLFSPVKDLPAGQAAVLPLYDGAPPPGDNVLRRVEFRVPMKIRTEFPLECDGEQLIAALLAAGAVAVEKLEISGIFWGMDADGT